MTLDDIKAEMLEIQSKYVGEFDRGSFECGWVLAAAKCNSLLMQLETVEPEAASLRRVREKVRKYCNSEGNSFMHEATLYEIIDAELKEQKNVKQKIEIEVDVPEGMEFDNYQYYPGSKSALINFKEKLDHELDEVRKRFPVGSRIVPKEGYYFSKTDRIVTDVYREADSTIYLTYKREAFDIELRNPAYQFEPLPLEPVWPDAIQDGWYIFQNADDWYLTNKKPSYVDHYVKFNSNSIRGCVFFVLENFLAPLGLTIDDLKIPDVPPEQRCWVKQSKKQ